MLDDAEFRVLLHVFLSAGQLQPRMAVCLAVDVAAAADRKQAREELGVVGCRGLYRRGPVVVTKRDALAMLAAAQIYSRPIHPPLRVGGFGNRRECLVAVGTFVIDDQILRRDNLADLPVGCSHLPVDILDYQCHLLVRRCRQRENGVVFAINRLQHQRLRDAVFETVKFAVVFPFDRRGLFRRVFLDRPIPLAIELDPVVHLQTHEIEGDERQVQHVVRHHSLLARGVVRRRYRQLQRICSTVNLQLHKKLGLFNPVRMLFDRR